MGKWIFSIILVGVGAYFLGETLQYKQDIYKGKTATEWAIEANKNQTLADTYKKSWLDTVSQLDKNPFLTTPTPTPTTPIVNNPHAGMKEIKGTNCSGQMGTNGRNDINMDCQPYDYWVNPNAPKPTDDPKMWTNISQ